MSNEAWKTNGDCSKCRKRDYCKTKCKANKRYLQISVFQAMAKAYAERLDKKNET